MHLYKFLYKWRFVFGGVFVIAVLFLLSLIVSSLDISKVQAKEAKPSAAPAYISDSPNVVTSGAAKAARSTGKIVESASYAAVRGIHAAATAVARGGTLAASGIQTGAVAVAAGIGNGVASVGQSTGQSIVVAGRAIGGGAGFVLKMPANAAGFAKNLVVQDVIQPSHDHPEVPIIDPNSPELRAALAALPPAAKAAAPAQHNAPAPDPAGPAWPLNGRVTAEFGVPHWPFQPTHTGIDISTGRAAGAVPVTPFRPGKVIAAVHSSRGYGNHVILDHGSGVTSVYAHLDSISVQTGQEVGMGAVLGQEGTTGLSTGPHLHFEIRVNGQATNPRQFINGNP